MARTQFTFTFRNAEPGASVTFSAAVYSSAADQVADGPTLALDSSRTVAVWSDATELSATWVDAAGTSVTAEASATVPVVVETGGVAGASAAPAFGGAASAVTYDHTVSGLAATNVKAALDELTAANHLGASTAATTPGTVTAKVEVFSKAGVSLGFVAVYDAIT